MEFILGRSKMASQMGVEHGEALTERGKSKQKGVEKKEMGS